MEEQSAFTSGRRLQLGWANTLHLSPSLHEYLLGLVTQKPVDPLVVFPVVGREGMQRRVVHSKLLGDLVLRDF